MIPFFSSTVVSGSRVRKLVEPPEPVTAQQVNAQTEPTLFCDALMRHRTHPGIAITYCLLLIGHYLRSIAFSEI